MPDEQLKLLVLDDDEAVRWSFVSYFEDQGWYVIPAVTAEDAMALVARERPDAAIVDIRLPGMDGNTFIRRVADIHPQMACVICTGSPEYSTPADVSQLPQVAARVFAKPVTDLTELRAEVIAQLNRCRKGMGAP